MKRPTALVVALLALTVAAFSACGSDDPDAAAPTDEVGKLGKGSLTRGCRFVFDGPGPADWRRTSAWIGPFGLAGSPDGPDFSIGPFEDDGLYRIKTPSLVEGHRPVEIWLSPEEAGRAGITAVATDRAFASVTYVPCRDKPRTVFAAGFVLRDRRPIRLRVRVGDRPARTLVVGRHSLRERVLQGARHDFRTGTGAGPAGFEACLLAGLRGALSSPRLTSVAVAADRRFGSQAAARLLNEIAAPVGERCGGRRFVPELVAAGEAAAER